MTSKDINELFKQKGLTLGSVESFTGGLFAREITKVPGASKFYKGGYVTYATEEKKRLLSVSEDTINNKGVVSYECAYEMAAHARCLLDVDVCVSFTGNAGPEAMENKPVGEVYIGIGTAQICRVYGYRLSGTREQIQEQAVNTAYELLKQII